MTETERIIRDFHRLYFEFGVHVNYGRGLHAQTRYHGLEAHQCPLDLWVFQEILCEIRPALVIELGTYLGGTTLFLAHQLGRAFSLAARSLAPKSSRAAVGRQPASGGSLGGGALTAG